MVCLMLARDTSPSSADPACSSVGDAGSLNEKSTIPMTNFNI